MKEVLSQMFPNITNYEYKMVHTMQQRVKSMQHFFCAYCSYLIWRDSGDTGTYN